MEFSFELGDRQAPRGHAIAYFRASDNPGQILATYLVVPPIAMDLAKYVPPMFAAHFGSREVHAVSAVPLPPVPEPVSSYQAIRRLAEFRGDDLLDLGTVNSDDLERMLLGTTEAAQRYQRLYQDYVERLPEPEAAGTGSLETIDADEILYQVLDERELLSEIAKLAGTLRYAIGGSDEYLRRETVAKMRLAVKRLPEKYRGEQIIEVAQIRGSRGDRLTQLYLDRGFKLAGEDYEALGPIEREIREVEASS